MKAAHVLERERARAAREALELAMRQQLQALKLTAGMEQQYRFHPQRLWRFDFAWPGRKLALEVDGGTWSGGRHTRGAGFEADCEKCAAAVLQGWRVLRATSGQVRSGVALGWIQQLMKEA